MKFRMITALTVAAIILFLLPFALVFFDVEGQGVFSVVAVVLFVYIGVFIFAGIPKFLVFGIYGLTISGVLLLIPVDYQLPIIIIGTFLFIMNPLSFFERMLETKMKDENVLPININLGGSYWPFYEYRKEMKNFYHLPQQKKLFTKKWYLQARQMTMILLYFTGVFVFIHEINYISNTLENFSWYNFFTLYIVIIIFLLAYFINKKGFTSTFRTFGISLFPPIIYLLLTSDVQDALRYSLSGGIFVFALVIMGVELYNLYQRVAYDAYHYYDVEQQLEVYANALFEPLVYNETMTLYGEYQLKINRETFLEHLHDILVYANFFRFIITAYSFSKTQTIIIAEFHHRGKKRAHKFKTFLETKYHSSTFLDLQKDPEKTLYEKHFFHQTEYIIARAHRLADLLKELHIDTTIILSLMVYFKNREDFIRMQKEVPMLEIPDLQYEDYITARIDIKTINNHYIIEEAIRDMLLTLMTYHGKYIRVSVFY